MNNYHIVKTNRNRSRGIPTPRDEDTITRSVKRQAHRKTASSDIIGSKMKKKMNNLDGEQVSRNVNSQGDLFLNLSSGQYDARNSFGPQQVLEKNSKSKVSVKSGRPSDTPNVNQMHFSDASHNR